MDNRWHLRSEVGAVGCRFIRIRVGDLVDCPPDLIRPTAPTGRGQGNMPGVLDGEGFAADAGGRHLRVRLEGRRDNGRVSQRAAFAVLFHAEDDELRLE